MYLTKIGMDLRHPSARQGLKDRQDLHRNLAQAFSGKFLYRVLTRSDTSSLLVLSEELPDAGALSARGYQLQETQNVSALKEKYADGAVLHFDLLAAPSKKAKEDGRDNSRRVFLSTPELRADWLKRQGDKYGFEVLEVHEPSAEEKLSVGRNSGVFALTAVELEGVLRIRDAARFWTAWEKGIGPEKAYGLGLMLLRR